MHDRRDIDLGTTASSTAIVPVLAANGMHKRAETGLSPDFRAGPVGETGPCVGRDRAGVVGTTQRIPRP